MSITLSPMRDFYCRACSSRGIVVEGKIHAEARVECADCGAVISSWGAFLDRVHQCHQAARRSGAQLAARSPNISSRHSRMPVRNGPSLKL